MPRPYRGHRGSVLAAYPKGVRSLLQRSQDASVIRQGRSATPCDSVHRNDLLATCSRWTPSSLRKSLGFRYTHLSEFRRVLRPGGRAAVSVNTVVERSYNHQINVVIGRYAPSLAEAVTRTFALGEASRLQLLFSEAGFVDIETHTVKHTFVLPSFDAYYGPFERGGAPLARRCASIPKRAAGSSSRVKWAWRSHRTTSPSASSRKCASPSIASASPCASSTPTGIRS